MKSNKFIETIGPEITNLRKARNLTQIEAAKLIGISQGFISKLESGLYVPDLQTWIKICEIYKLPFKFPRYLSLHII
jgi:transcriptional regulator with XRE-family HTH domain